MRLMKMMPKDNLPGQLMEKKSIGLSLIDKGTKSDSFEFTGAALALHTANSQGICRNC